MRTIKFFAVMVAGIFFTDAVLAAAPYVKKVLPQLIDAQGKNSLSPSLYERDAYQAYLRKNAKERAGLRFNILWGGGTKDRNLRLRVEMRGAQTNSIQEATLEAPVKKTGWFRTWSTLDLTGQAYQKFGELSAWRVTLWDGDQPLSEIKSFLW